MITVFSDEEVGPRATKQLVREHTIRGIRIQTQPAASGEGHNLFANRSTWEWSSCGFHMTLWEVLMASCTSLEGFLFSLNF